MSPSPDETPRPAVPSNRVDDSEPSPDLATNPASNFQDTPFASPSPADGSDDFALPGYHVRAELARGGMGVVYSADDAAFGRAVAIKVLLPGWQWSRPAVARFGTEARITGRLQHPGIPPAHAHGILDDGRPYLVMKLIHGQTLTTLLDDRPDPTAGLPRFVQVFEQICQAVGYAHGSGVIHRDLKPHNVMVGAFGEVQVMDWGLAKDLRAADAEPGPSSDAAPLSHKHAETESGSVLGTLPYMPPEQARGDVGRIDARSDVFSLGGILCTILTGQPPYTGTRVEVMAAAAGATLSDALARLDGCGADPELVAVARRCLTADPADRPANGGAVADLVAAYRAAVEDRLRTAERDWAAAEARAAGLRATRRWQAVAAGIVGVVTIGVGATAWALDRQATNRAEAAYRRQVEDEKRDAAERERATRNGLGIEGLLAQADAALAADDAAAATGALAQARVRLADGGGDHLRPRLARAEADLEALRELTRIDTLRWTTRGGKYQTADALAQVPAAAGKLGIDLDATPPAEAAARLADSAVRDRLVAAVDLWFVRGRSATGRAILRAADPDDYRNRVRDAVAAEDLSALDALADQADALAQPPWFASVLGQIEAIPTDRRRAILRAANRSRPADVTVLMTLGGLDPIGQKDGAAERAGWYRAAVAARPASPTAWNSLGIALRDAGATAEAIEAFRQARRADPTYPRAAANLGIALGESGDTEGAVAAFREAVQIAPDRAENWFNLGVGLGDRKDFAGAATAFTTAARHDPHDARIRFNLGLALARAGDPKGAIAAYREAVRLDRDYARAHAVLGEALQAVGDAAGARAAFREAARLDPTRFGSLLPLEVAPPPRPVVPGR